jgi:hypothetical protein
MLQQQKTIVEANKLDRLFSQLIMNASKTLEIDSQQDVFCFCLPSMNY